jgi:O-antigen ligase
MNALFAPTERILRLLWGTALFALPVTSFRWFPLLGEGTLVRPLAMYPLMILLPILLLLGWRRKIWLYWPGAIVALGAFVLFAFAATAFGLLIDPIPLRGQIYSGRAVRALGTLIIGLAFFLCAVWMNKNEEDLCFSMRWILAGLCLDLAWSGLQAVTFYTGLLDKEAVTHWQLAFSMRELVRSNRISGLAYEPAWLAGQMSTIFLPFLLASALTGFRLTRFRWVEPVLLGTSLLVLLATYSRGGLLTALGAMGLTIVFLGRGSVRAVRGWFLTGFRGRLPSKLMRTSILVGLAGVLAGSFLFLGQRDYFRRLWEVNAESLSEYIIDINAGARGAYTAGALAAYEQYPWTGAGLGASGFFIYHNLPDWALTTVPEIARQLSPESRLYPNPKNLYVRLLAETGVIGFILFLAFQLQVLGAVLALWRRELPWMRFAATAGMVAWWGITFYNFTQDSLTTPNLWLVPGIMLGLSAGSALEEQKP